MQNQIIQGKVVRNPYAQMNDEVAYDPEYNDSNLKHLTQPATQPTSKCTSNHPSADQSPNPNTPPIPNLTTRQASPSQPSPSHPPPF